jgi:universal stress protein E
MQAIRRILVIVQPELTEALALKRAKLIAGVTQSQLHLLICAEDPKDYSVLLAELAEQLNAEGYSVSTQQYWKENPHQTVIAVQQAEGCALVIKEHQRDSLLKKAFLTPEDWKLLRYCPCPVLMVKTEKPWSGRPVLAAVDVGNSDNEHRTLHSGIVSHGFDIASLTQGELYVLSAHPSPMLSAADPTFQLRETIEARYREACKQFQKDFEIADDHLYIKEGPADVLIPKTAHKLDAAVTVIGTVARTGLSGALMGNTAEVVLDSLESDVLVLKPDDIIEHLEELLSNR